MVTFNNIIQAFNNFSIGHMQLNSFHSGDISDFQSQQNLFPAMIVKNSNSTISKQRVALSFNIMFIDLLSRGNLNDIEIKSDMLQICGDFIKYLETAYEQFRISNDVKSLVFFSEKLDDDVAGCMVSIVIEYPLKGHCNIPFISDEIVESDIPDEPPIVLTPYNFSTLVENLSGGTNITLDVDFINKLITINSSGVSEYNFSNLVNNLSGGTNITLDIDNSNEIITINSSGGATEHYMREYDSSGLTLFCGFAFDGSLQTDAVWTITKIITNVTGDVVSSEQFTNVKWSDRYIL